MVRKRLTTLGERGVQVNLERNVYCLLGLPFDATDMAGAVQRVRDAVAQRTPCFISTPNLNFLVNSQKDSEFRDSVIISDLSVADGMPLVWIARLLGIPIRERVAGSGLFEELKSKGGSRTIAVYFFGGPDGAAEAAGRRLNAEAAQMVCVGFESPGQGSVEALSREESIARINASGADLLVLALGATKGQAWIERNRSRITVPVISHLGAVVNFAAGRVRRAPRWMQNAGLEWLWRIREEPALWRRYAADGCQLVSLLLTRVVPYIWWMHRQRFLGPRARMGVFQLEERPSGTTVHLGGAWGQDNLPPLRECLSTLAAAKRNIRIDLRGVSYVDSSFLGVLMLLYGVQKQQGRWARCEGAGIQLRKIFIYACCEFLLADAEELPAAELDEEPTHAAE